MMDVLLRHVEPMIRAAETRILQAVDARLRNLTARLVLRTVLTTCSEGEGGRNALVDAAEGFLPADGSQPSSDDAERMEFAGFLVIPVPKGPTVRIGDNSPVFLFPLANGSYRPGGGKQGETCQYNLGDKQGTHWIRKDGKIEARSSGGASHVQDELGGHQINSKTADNKDVVVNNGTLKVALVTNAVLPATDMSVWQNAVNAAITALKNGDPVTVPPNPPTPIGLIDPNAGAANFKA